MENAVEIKNLSIKLGRTYLAINELSIDIPSGKIVGIIGPSGAGKSTLIKAIVGRQKISKGEISVLGQDAGSAWLRKEVAYMTQGLSVYPDLTVNENLRYFATMAETPKRRIEEVIKTVLHKVDMTDQAKKLVSDLSGGQKQRVSLAVALLGTPRLLVLDEPTVGLDPVLRERLWRLFNQLSKNGITVIISSHVMDEASRCDSLLLIRDGNLLADGAPEKLCEVTSTKSVEDAFITLVGSAL